MPASRKHLISASARIPASQERVYAVIADYHDGHPRILPPQFIGLTVERGGVGAGTIVAFQMRLLGRKQSFRAAITESEPGRVLVETDLDTNGAVTAFQVDRGPGTCRPERVPGAIEALVSTWLLRPIYTRELALLAAVVEGK